MKYELAFSNIHNCTNKGDHLFIFIKDKEEKKAIRKEHPKLKCALWKCSFCGKIKESM